MTEQDFQSKRGEINKAPVPESQEPISQEDIDEYGKYLSVLEAIRTPKRPIDTAPSFIPRNFAQQIQIYENGSTRRLYIYVGNAWRYIALT